MLSNIEISEFNFFLILILLVDNLTDTRKKDQCNVIVTGRKS